MADPTTVFRNEAGLVQGLTDELTSATIRLRLYTGTALAAASTVANLAANELSGNGYPAGGIPLTLDSVAWDATDGRAEATLTVASLSPTGGDLTWRQAAITVNGGTNYIWCVYQCAADETATNGSSYQFNVKLNEGPQNATVDIVDN